MKAPRGFAGFPAGKAASTPLPNLFFSDLLPAIDHLGELKVTLYAFWALGRQRGHAALPAPGGPAPGRAPGLPLETGGLAALSRAG